jgi:hypothetical protein
LTARCVPASKRPSPISLADSAKSEVGGQVIVLSCRFGQLLSALALASMPFPHAWASTIAEATTTVAAPRVHETQLDPRAQYSANPSYTPPREYHRDGRYPGPSGRHHDAGLPVWLGVDEAPQRLEHYVSAGGPLERHTGRPGAWYAVAFVPVSARWPVQLWAWQKSPSHQMRLTALDGWPATIASVVVPLPLSAEATTHGRPLIQSGPFVLPAQSAAEGVFVLIEQWSPRGDPPAPVWLQARYAQGLSPYGSARGEGAWWSRPQEPATASARTAPPSSSPSVPPLAHVGPSSPPPSALTAPRETVAVTELPILRLVTSMPAPAPMFEPWWDR